jgi:hypothetical protein
VKSDGESIADVLFTISQEAMNAQTNVNKELVEVARLQAVRLLFCTSSDRFCIAF